MELQPIQWPINDEFSDVQAMINLESIVQEYKATHKVEQVDGVKDGVVKSVQYNRGIFCSLRSSSSIWPWASLKTKLLRCPLFL